MAIEYTMKAVCDRCKATIEPGTVVKKTDIDCLRWEWERKWSTQGVMLGLPSRFGKRKLYCAACAGR